MTYDELTLSTSTTIARHESEINELAGTTQRFALYHTSETLPTLEFSEAVDTVIYTLDTGATGTDTVTLDSWEIPASKKIVNIAAYFEGAQVGEFTVSEGSGFTLYAKDDASFTATLSSDIWLLIDMARSWNSKMELAKDLLKNRVEEMLAKNGYVVNYADGEVLIDIITNPSVLLVACDYLTLHLIYRDLWQNLNSELFESKASDYWSRYLAEVDSAYFRFALDPALSGTATIYSDIRSGRIVR